MIDEEAKGLPFLKGKTLKRGDFGGGGREVVSGFWRRWVLRDWKAEEGESGSWALRVLDLMGLPANAWALRLMDMVAREEKQVLFVRVLERKSR